MSKALPFDINDKNLYNYCMEFFKKFNILKDTCNIVYQTEIEGE